VAIVPKPDTSEVEIPNKVLTWDPVNAIGVAEDPVLFPIIELAARFAIFPKVTAPPAIVVAKVPVTSLVKVIVWSPVLVPLDVPEKLDADIVPSIMTLATWEVVELRMLSVLVVAPVKSNIVFPPEKVIVGVVPEKVIGVAEDKVNAIAVEAPRPVTDENVSASVAERFNVPPRDTLPPPERIPLLLMVTEELLRLELPMLDKVFDAPEIVKPEAVPAIVTPLICPPVTYILLALWVAIVPNPEISDVEMPSKVFTCVAVKATGVAALPVLFPIIELAAKFAILERDTAPLPIVVLIAVAPLPETSPLKVIVWLSVK